MFGLFKKKTKVEILEKNYKKLMTEAYNLSTTNRAASDIKQAEAQEVLKEIDNLKEN